MALSKFESMLKTNKVYFFDSSEFEEIIHHYIDDGRHSLAKKAVKLGLEQHPCSVVLRLLRAEILIYEDKFIEAKKLLNELEVIEPTNEEVYIQQAAICSKENLHIEAIDLLKKALGYTNDIVDVTSILAMEYLYLDDFEQARLNFAKCLEVDIEDYSSLYNVIYCFDMDEKHQEAIDYLLVYIDLNPYCEVAWHQLGRQYMVLNEFEEALRAFDYAVVIDDSFIGAYLEKAKTLEVLNRYEEAIENYQITIELDDPTAFVYLRIGECFRRLEKDSKAADFYKKAVIEDPLLDKGWVALADVYSEKGDYTQALYYINKVLTIDELNAVYWQKFGEINLKLCLFEESVSAFKKCISLDDTIFEVWLALADVVYFTGNNKEALEYLVKAKNRFMDSAEIEYRMFGVFMELNKEKEALIHLKNGLAEDFEFKDLIKDLFPVSFGLEKVKAIIEEFKSSDK
jgi:tetratricopeptide (TPR) repeat protein